MEPEPQPSPMMAAAYPPLPEGYKMGHWTRPGVETKVKAVLAFQTPEKKTPEKKTVGPNPDLLGPNFSPASLPVAVSTKMSPDKTLTLIGQGTGGSLASMMAEDLRHSVPTYMEPICDPTM